MKKIYLTILISLLLFHAKDVKSDDVNFYGFKPASVDSLLPFQPNNKPIQHKQAVFISFLAEIDKKGNLKKIKTINKKDSQYLSYVEPYLRQLSFSPAKLNNKQIKSILPIDIIFNKKINSPLFKFPLLQDKIIVDNELFERTCTINNLELPQVLSFPPYFSDFNSMDTSNRYPYVIEKIAYEKGEVVGVENYMSTHDPFVQQIQSAILYADIKLPKLKKKELSEDLYLMVSFFPQLSYPIARFDVNSVDSSNLLHHYRVRIINRFSQLLSEPIPKRVPSDRYSRKLFDSNINDSIDILIRIDTLGRAAMIAAGTQRENIRSSIRKLIPKFKFYPAVNQKNELVEFRGYLRIGPLDDLDIRISYLWMN